MSAVFAACQAVVARTIFRAILVLMRLDFLSLNDTYVMDNAAVTVTAAVTGNSAAKPVCEPRPALPAHAQAADEQHQ